jgi:hypothetical protein
MRDVLAGAQEDETDGFLFSICLMASADYFPFGTVSTTMHHYFMAFVHAKNEWQKENGA